ncbi:hypothetical protein GS432_04845 [Rhodococcus hoagii]|nr:hypothetical protein [Prescottella equi]
MFSGAPGFTASTRCRAAGDRERPGPGDHDHADRPADRGDESTVTLTANLDPTNASGTVQFKDNGTNIGSAVAVADGVAALQYSFATAENHSITAASQATPASRTPRRRRNPSP